MSVNAQNQGVRLSDLLPAKWLPSDVGDVLVSGIELDHRKLKVGDVFIALVGTQVDARQYIGAALRNGAAAVIKEMVADDESIAWHAQTPIIPVQNLSLQVSDIASRFLAFPSQQVRCIGVTGTNGKTTVAHLLSQLLAKLDGKSALMGTLGNGVVAAEEDRSQVGSLVSTGLTTADAVTVQKALADFVAQGVKHCAMEVSSHSLHQHRVAAVQFQTAVFTNLSRDHLDYHETMERYGAVKAALFKFPSLKHAVINMDDAFGRELLEQSFNSTVLSYSLRNDEASVYCKNIAFSSQGVTACIVTPFGEGKIESNLLGEFNLSNLLAVIAAAIAEGFELSMVLAEVPLLMPVCGRMEVVAAAMQPLTVVDYAHTPDGLENALSTLKEHCANQLWCVFGCGGDRDRGKRAEMATIAEQFADQVVVTSDNPRTESPEEIEGDIRQGFASPDNVVFQRDRAQAIKYVIEQADAADTILIAGKGHEDYQLVGTEKMPFSDVNHARVALQRRVEGLS